jgi:TonB family protein
VAGRGEAGPRATVDIPRDLARGSGTGGGAGGGPGGTSAGSGSTGAGAGSGGRAASGVGTGLIDTRDPDFSEYFRVIEARVRAAWKYPEKLGGTTQTVKLGFSLRLDGAVDDARVVSSTSGAMNESALTAMRKAAPFPPLPAKFRSLVGQPLVMSFTVTIK